MSFMIEIIKRYDPIAKHAIGSMQKAMDNTDEDAKESKIKYPNGVFQLNGVLKKKLL